jgi:hypothetical protein
VNLRRTPRVLRSAPNTPPLARSATRRGVSWPAFVARIGLPLAIGVLAGFAEAEGIRAHLANHELRVDARGVLTFVLHVENSSARERLLHGVIELPAGWIVRTPLTALLLPARSTRAFPVVAQAPAGRGPGTLLGHIRLLGEYGERLVTLDLVARLPTRSDLELTLLNGASTFIGELPRLELVVRNSGNITETVQLESDWAATFDPETLTLEPGASRRVAVLLAAPSALQSNRPLRLTLRAIGDAGGRAEVTHHLTFIPTELDESSLWHTVPIELRIGATLTGGNLTGGTPTGGNPTGGNREAPPGPALRVRLAGGGAWRDGASSTFAFALHTDLFGGDPRVQLVWRTTDLGVRVGHAEVGVHPSLSRAHGFALIADGRFRLGDATHLTWMAFAQTTTPSGAAAGAPPPRFGVRIGTSIPPLGHVTLAAQSNPGLSEARIDARLQLRFPGPLTVGATLDGAVHAPDGATSRLRGGIVLRAEHPRASAGLEARFTSAGFQEVARDTRELVLRADLDLLRLLQVDALRSLRAEVEARSARSVVDQEDATLPPESEETVEEGTSFAELERLRLSLDAATERSRGGIDYTRSDERPADSAMHTLQQALTLRFTTRVGDSWNLTPQATWSSRDRVDSVTGAVDRSETLRASLSGALHVGAATLTPALTLTIDPAERRIASLRAALTWRAPFSDGWQGEIESSFSHRPAGSHEVTLAAEIAQQTDTPAGGVVVRPSVRFSDGEPTRLTLSVRAPELMLLGFTTAASFTLRADAEGGLAGSGQLQLRGNFPLGDLGTLDLRAQIVHGERGFSAELGGQARATVGTDATLSVEAQTTFGAERPTATRFGVTLQRLLRVRSGHKRGVGSFEGSVLRTDGTPVPHVALRVAGQTIASDTNGRFRFPAVAVGEHYVQVIPGTLPQELLLSPSGPLRANVVAGAVSELHLLALHPATLQGEIRFALPEGFEHLGDDARGRNGDHRGHGFSGGEGTDGVTLLGSGDLRADGAHVAGITLQLERHGEVRLALSDDSGHFQLRDLEPGTWNLRIDHGRLPGVLRFGDYPRALHLAEGGRHHLVIPLEPRVRRVTLAEGGEVRTP